MKNAQIVAGCWDSTSRGTIPHGSTDSTDSSPLKNLKISKTCQALPDHPPPKAHQDSWAPQSLPFVFLKSSETLFQYSISRFQCVFSDWLVERLGFCHLPRSVTRSWSLVLMKDRSFVHSTCFHSTNLEAKSSDFESWAVRDFLTKNRISPATSHTHVWECSESEENSEANMVHFTHLP